MNQGKDEAKVPDTPRPTLKIKLKLPTKLSNVNTTSPQGAVKKHDINAKAGHVTDPVSDSVSSGKKEARLQAPPATKRSAETGVDEKPHKKRRISPKLPHSKSSPASSHATDTVGESKPSLMKEGTAHAPPTKKRSAEAAVDDKPDKKRKLNPELPESKSEPANVLQGRINRSKPVGLRNNGKCCYSNSTLQCLLQTPPIRKYCIAKGDSFVDPFTSDKVTIEDVAAYSKHSTRRGTRAKANLTSQFKEVNPNDV